MYLQPELPNFGGNIGKKPAQAAWCLEEGRRILGTFGNHPSFVMLALGNELGGGRDARASMVKELRQFDPRHLYAQASNYDLGDPHFAAGDDYWTTFRTRRGEQGSVRGSYAHVDAPLGHVQAGPPGTTGDYARASPTCPCRSLATKSGSIKPSRISGRSKNTPACCGRGISRHSASGSRRGACSIRRMISFALWAHSVICYREEIEAACGRRASADFNCSTSRTFPARARRWWHPRRVYGLQGTDRAKAWREFCCQTVPLAIFPKYTWTTDESFAAKIKVAHYGPATLAGATIAWTLTEVGGKTIAAGKFPAKDIATGALAEMGTSPRRWPEHLRRANSRYPLRSKGRSSRTITICGFIRPKSTPRRRRA